jgi:hypothetical protein
MTSPAALDAVCTDIRGRVGKVIELLQFSSRGQGEFANAPDTYVRMHLAADQLEEALMVMRRRVLPWIDLPY